MSQLTKYAVRFAFDGSDFCGWQVQRGVGSNASGKPSIESQMVAAIEKTCGEVVPVTASGRTDAGVHASGQVAHFSLSCSYRSPKYFVDALNENLPSSIRILEIGECPETFRANRAVRKQYSYFFQQGSANLPHLQRYCVWTRRDLDVDAMAEGARYLAGKHDFVAFSSSMNDVVSTEREVFEVELSQGEIPLPGNFEAGRHELIRLRIVGSGFLRQMVRRIAGTLKRVGEARLAPEEVRQILESRDRNGSGPTAPAEGLWLDRVWYAADTNVEFLDTLP